MSRENQREWPPVRDSGVERTAPAAFFTHPNGYHKSERSLAGPLRRGTARDNVGPRGGNGGNSDMGLDRITPRRFDPMGSHNERSPPREESVSISSELRNSKRRKD